MKRFEGPKGQMFGGAQAVGFFILNIGNLEWIGDFSHSKNLSTIACKRNYFILQTRDWKFCLLEKVLCGMYQCD